MSLAVLTDNLGFRYSNAKSFLFRQVNLRVSHGEIVAIAGASGSGKSTLCKCISGIIPHIENGVIEGNAHILDTATTALQMWQIAHKLGIIFQNPETQLFTTCVEDEIAFSLENFGYDPVEIDRIIDQTLDIVGLADKRFANPAELSGGEKQLIAIAAVLAPSPEILIFDEAMSQLDQLGKSRISELIIRLKKSDKCIIMIEHDKENMKIADTVKFLTKTGLIEVSSGLEELLLADNSL